MRVGATTLPFPESVQSRFSAASCRFSYGSAGGALKAFAPAVQMAARKGSWIGVKVGLVALAAGAETATGHADFDALTFSRYAAP